MRNLWQRKARKAHGAICVLALALSFFIFNIKLHIVNGASMHPTIPCHSVAVARKVPFEALREGDIVIFRATAMGGALTVHRITRRTQNGFHTKGDANSHEDASILTESNYISKLCFSIPLP